MPAAAARPDPTRAPAALCVGWQRACVGLGAWPEPPIVSWVPCRLVRVEGREAFFVPQEKPPLNRAHQEYWPPGWHLGRPVETERDIFELLGLPYRPPHERQAP